MSLVSYDAITRYYSDYSSLCWFKLLLFTSYSSLRGSSQTTAASKGQNSNYKSPLFCFFTQMIQQINQDTYIIIISHPPTQPNSCLSRKSSECTRTDQNISWLMFIEWHTSVEILSYLVSSPLHLPVVRAASEGLAAEELPPELEPLRMIGIV